MSFSAWMLVAMAVAVQLVHTVAQGTCICYDAGSHNPTGQGDCNTNQDCSNLDHVEKMKIRALQRYYKPFPFQQFRDFYLLEMHAIHIFFRHLILQDYLICLAILVLNCLAILDD